MHCLAVVWVGGDGCYASLQQTQGSISAVAVSIVSLSYHELPFASSASLTASSIHLRKEDRKSRISLSVSLIDGFYLHSLVYSRKCS